MTPKRRSGKKSCLVAKGLEIVKRSATPGTLTGNGQTTEMRGLSDHSKVTSEQCCTHGLVSGPSTPPGELRTLPRQFAAWKVWKLRGHSHRAEGVKESDAGSVVALCERRRT